MEARHILLTGRPGCGKTTVVRRVVERLRGGPVCGFWTEEVHEGGRRVGFAIETVSGERGVLAHEARAKGPRVSRYRVDVEGFDGVGVAEIERALAAGQGVLVVDEIGKMELFSQAFARAVGEAFESRLRVVATIMQRPEPFADGIKARPDVSLTVVTPGNRDALAGEIADSLTSG